MHDSSGLGGVDMATARFRQAFTKATHAIFDPCSAPGELLAAVQEMSRLFGELTQIDDHSSHPQDDQETHLTAGKAISPRDAGRCLLDFLRTSQFLRGIDSGIRSLQHRFPGQLIEIVYAGCGPYATLALPLCTRSYSKNLRFTLIDIHERSLRGVQTLVEHLGFSDAVRAYIQGDATDYQHPEGLPLHMVMTETMQRGLAKEPQVAITANLVPQLMPGGILIPQRIFLELVLGDMGKEFELSPAEDQETGPLPPVERERVRLKTLLDVSAETIADLMKLVECDQHSEGLFFPKMIVPIPPIAEDTHFSAMICTRVEIYDGFALDDYDSGLTCPIILRDLGTLRGNELFEFQYRVTGCPGFVHHQIG